MKKEKEVQSVIANLKGIVKFPNLEEGKFSCKLLLKDEEIDKVETLIEPLNDEITINELEHDSVEYQAINVKTNYAIPIYDTKGVQINAESEDYQLYDGAKVILKLVFKPYKFKKKTGVTAYLMGAVVIEQGVKFESSTTFEDFNEDLDDIQF